MGNFDKVVMPTVYVTDVQEAEVDDVCPRRTWFSRFEGGNGILSRDTLLSDLMVAETHKDLRFLKGMADISPEAVQMQVDNIRAGLTGEDTLEVKKMELLYRRLGWFAAYALYVEPGMRALYEDIPVEFEVPLDHDPFWVMVKPDRVVRNRVNGEVTYLEYVPMPPGPNHRKWLEQWTFNARLHLGMAAVEDSVKFQGKGIYVTDGQVMGLNEGYFSSFDGKLCHPYVWGYYNRTTTQWSAAFKPEAEGFKMTPVWEFPGGIVGWVQLCGSTTAAHQFPYSPAVELDNRLVDEWVSRRLHRERTIGSMRDVCDKNDHLRKIHFERRTGQCVPIIGPKCPYQAVCWSAKGSSEVAAKYIENIIPVDIVRVVK